MVQDNHHHRRIHRLRHHRKCHHSRRSTVIWQNVSFATRNSSQERELSGCSAGILFILLVGSKLWKMGPVTDAHHVAYAAVAVCHLQHGTTLVKQCSLSFFIQANKYQMELRKHQFGPLAEKMSHRPSLHRFLLLQHFQNHKQHHEL